jgi:D-alanine--poly(phosphoribitol) ligase subunit 2
MSPRTTVLEILAQVTESDEVRRDLDLPIYERQVIDSLGTVQLIVRLGEELHLDISPADVDLAAWATPRLLMADIERRLGLVGASK